MHLFAACLADGVVKFLQRPLGAGESDDMGARRGKGEALYTFGSGPEFFPVANTELDIAQFNFVCQNSR
jgi:hypothetical protein